MARGSGWTLETLKEHFDRLMEQRFRSQETALDKLATETREWKDQANEWRGQSKDQTAQFPTRLEVEAKLEALAKEIKANREALTEQIKTKNMQIFLSIGVGALATLIAVFNFARNLSD